MANRKRDKRKAELILAGELLRYDMKLQVFMIRDGFQTGLQLVSVVRNFFARR